MYIYIYVYVLATDSKGMTDAMWVQFGIQLDTFFENFGLGAPKAPKPYKSNGLRAPKASKLQQNNDLGTQNISNLIKTMILEIQASGGAPEE